MARSVLLQDWITLKGDGITALVQPVDDYVDLLEGIDVTFLLDVADVSGTALTIRYQTSPIVDDALFRSMDYVVVLNSAITQTIVRHATAATPLTRWVRWSIDGSSEWRMTFRVWMSVRER